MLQTDWCKPMKNNYHYYQHHEDTPLLISPASLSLTLVLATPISGPALTCTPQCVSRLMELPTVLVIPTVSAPLCLQYLKAFSVSAVSPGGREGFETFNQNDYYM